MVVELQRILFTALTLCKGKYIVWNWKVNDNGQSRRCSDIKKRGKGEENEEKERFKHFIKRDLNAANFKSIFCRVFYRCQVFILKGVRAWLLIFLLFPFRTLVICLFVRCEKASVFKLNSESRLYRQKRYFKVFLSFSIMQEQSYISIWTNPAWKLSVKRSIH